MEKITQFLIDIVKKAASFITPEFEVKAKDDKGDLVTNFDLEIEKFMISKIKENYKDFTIISEEFNSNNQLAKNCFVIDPIDGTVNFAHGLPIWGIQVACIKNNKPCSSVIYLPKFNELYYADKSGAFLNNEKIVVKAWPKQQALFGIEGGKQPDAYKNLTEFTKNVRMLNCICVLQAWVACGKFNGAIFKKENPWDYIPGQYLIKQAGGYIINEPNCHIAASNKELANLLKDVC